MEYFHATSTKVRFLNMTTDGMTQYYANYEVSEKVGLKFVKILNSMGAAVSVMLNGSVQHLVPNNTCPANNYSLCSNSRTTLKVNVLLMVSLVF